MIVEEVLGLELVQVALVQDDAVGAEELLVVVVVHPGRGLAAGIDVADHRDGGIRHATDVAGHLAGGRGEDRALVLRVVLDVLPIQVSLLAQRLQAHVQPVEDLQALVVSRNAVELEIHEAVLLLLGSIEDLDVRGFAGAPAIVDVLAVLEGQQALQGVLPVRGPLGIEVIGGAPVGGVLPGLGVGPAEVALALAVHAEGDVQLAPFLVHDVGEVVDHGRRTDLEPVGFVDASRLRVLEVDAVALGLREVGGVEDEGLRPFAARRADAAAVLALDIAREGEAVLVALRRADRVDVGEREGAAGAGEDAAFDDDARVRSLDVRMEGIDAGSRRCGCCGQEGQAEEKVRFHQNFRLRLRYGMGQAKIESILAETACPVPVE